MIPRTPMTTRIAPLLFLPAMLFAGELTLETGPFRIEHQFKATVLPVDPPVLELEPESWQAFVVETLVDHGTTVKKGTPLITFEREAYDRRVEDLGREVAAKELAVARQKLDLAKLVEEQGIALEAVRREMETAAEDLDYFKKIGRPAAEAQVEQNLVGARFSVESAEEELKQLKQMYEADDLTEDTEEIILKRQQLMAEMAKFRLSEAEREAKRTLETELPRQLEGLERVAKKATIAFGKSEKNLPRELGEAKIALAGAEAGLKRDQLELERIKKDGALLEWKAPADGVVFHGGLEGEAWDFGDLAKSLKIGGTVPLRRALVTLVPATTPTRLSAEVDGKVAASLKKGDVVTLSVPGAGGADPTGAIDSVDPVPGPDGKHTAALTATWPEGSAPKVGSNVDCLSVAHDDPAALVVPLKALVATPKGGWAVELKLADGKTETRPVKRGPTNGEKVQIREGLEPGQVIVAPE